MILWNVRIIVLSTFLFSAAFAFSNEKTNKKSVHLAPNYPKKELTQGEEMLGRKPNLKPNTVTHSKKRYQVVGFCKGGRGIASTQLVSKNYEECLDPELGVSGSSASDRYGVSGRQAGVGILLGK